MPTYTFHTLSPADFEELCCDLISKLFDVPFEIFASGPDSGIDLRHTYKGNNNLVVQCKHYYQSGFSKLKSSLKNVECPKIISLSPKRYILATSVALTPSNKNEILKLLRPYCKSTSDILGQDDLNALLRSNPDIETSHHKLWLTSTAVLQRVLNQGAAVWNGMERTEIEHKLSLYVQTVAFDHAIKLLNDYNYCLISGIPGIGKTTLAQMLVMHLIDNDYSLISVRHDINEVFELLDTTSKQVIYYDDFLGQAGLGEQMGKNEDSALLRLIHVVRRSKKTKLILTTREYLLAAAKQNYERLANQGFDFAKCTVELENYTRSHRARIFYNHLYFSKLSSCYIDAVLADHAYKRIIDHSTYSPRLIEWMTSEMGTAGIQPASYAVAIVQNLDNPYRIWEHAFREHLTHDARDILYIIATINGEIQLDALLKALCWDSEKGAESAPIGKYRRRLRIALKFMYGTFVRSFRFSGDVFVGFHNPSIAEFVRRKIGGDSAIAIELLERAVFFEQVAILGSVSKLNSSRFLGIAE